MGFCSPFIHDETMVSFWMGHCVHTGRKRPSGGNKDSVTTRCGRDLGGRSPWLQNVLTDLLCVGRPRAGVFWEKGLVTVLHYRSIRGGARVEKEQRKEGRRPQWGRNGQDGQGKRGQEEEGDREGIKKGMRGYGSSYRVRNKGGTGPIGQLWKGFRMDREETIASSNGCKTL